MPSFADLGDPAYEPPAPAPAPAAEKPQAELRAYKPTFSERVGSTLQDILMGLGADPYKAGHLAHGVRDLIGLSPLGIPIAMLDTRDYVNRGDTLGAIMSAGAMIPGGRVASRAAEEVLPLIRREQSRISPRLPTAVRATEDPLGENRLQIDLDAMKADPKLFEHNVGLARNYPNLPLDDRMGPADKVAEAFIEHAKDNLLALHDAIPEATRARSKLWYEGGNKIANDFATEYGAHPNSSAAAIAALSPQKDWFMNVDLARRVHDIHFNQRDTAFTPEMEATAQRIFRDKKADAAGIDPVYQGGLDAIRGKKYSELEDPYEKAMWLRTYDEAHNDRSHRLVTPEGAFGGPVLTAKGEPSGTGWGSLGEIGKAIQALEAEGDVAKISGLMGERHKVRSFYNNIIDPQSAHGDVTMDTHAVAAALMRPLSGNSLEVAHNFNNYAGKGLTNAKGSAITGVQGTYPLYAEAYRRAAEERGILPREMQSITWEGVRGLFPDTFKTKKNAEAIDNIWREHRDGILSADEARAKIFDKAGGINPPDWHGQQ